MAQRFDWLAGRMRDSKHCRSPSRRILTCSPKRGRWLSHAVLPALVFSEQPDLRDAHKGTSKNAPWIVKDGKMGDSQAVGENMDSTVQGDSPPSNENSPLNEDIRCTLCTVGA